MTSRERAEPERIWMHPRTEYIRVDIAADRIRALLTDEAMVEVVANAIANMDQEMRTGGDERSGYRFLAEAALTAIQRKAGVE